MTRVHIDTDFAGDPDDACALVMALGWETAEVVGITTVADPDGRRAGYVRRMLELSDRTDIPVAVGAGVSLGGQPMGGLPDHERYWGGDPVEPSWPAGHGAIDLLEASLDAGATLVAIGPYTNLALLHAARPGRLDDVPVVVMGGWVFPPAIGLPAWSASMDWNVQCDTEAARVVFESADLTLATLTTTVAASLNARDLPRLRASGEVGELLARQAAAYAEDEGRTEIGRRNDALPDDLLNFHYDPVACAVALGWDGARVETHKLVPAATDGVMRFDLSAEGRATKVVTHVDAAAFTDVWLSAVERAQKRS